MSLVTFDKKQWPTLAFIICLPIFTFISKASSDIYLSFTGLFFIYLSIKNKHYEWLKWPWVRVVFIFICVAMISAFFSPFPKEAFIQSFIYLRWPLAAIALVSIVFTSHERLRLFERAAFFFLIFVVLDTIFQFFYGKDIFGHPIGGTSRLSGPFTKTLVGAYSLKLFFFALMYIYLSVEKTKRNIILLSFSILLFNMFLLITGERIVFVLGVFFLCLWLFVVTMVYKVLRKMIPFVIASGVAAFGVTIIFARELLEARFLPFIEAIKNFSSTTYSDIFNSAYQLWLLNPLFGVGTRMYSEVCLAKLGYPQDESLFEQVNGLCVRHPHNIYLELLAQNGLVGLSLFIMILYFVFKMISAKYIWKQEPLLAVIITSSVLVTFWPLASSMSIFANNYAGAVWLTIAWAIARSQHLPFITNKA